MSVVISSPVTTGVVGAINCIKKLRMNAPSILGTVDLYFFLTTSKRLYFTANPAVNAPQEISLSAIPFLANATLHGMEVMVATESDANDNVKYPVVYLFGMEETGLEFNGGSLVTKPFVAVLKCGGLPTQPPTVSIYWPCIDGTPAVPTDAFDPAGPVEFIGYDGPTNPLEMNFFGSSFGRARIQASRSGLPTEQNSATDFWNNGTELRVYAPAMNIVPNVRFSGIGVISQRARLALMRRVSPTSEQLLLCEIWAETGTDNYATASFVPMGPGSRIAYPLIDEGANAYAAECPLVQADYDWMDLHGVKQIVLGWGLSGSDDPDGQTDIRVYGDASVVLLSNDGQLRICGDGAGSLIGLDTPAGDDQPIRAVAVGYQGDLNDADTSAGDQSVPLYRKGVVLVSGRYVFYSANGLAIGAAVLTLPEYEDNGVWDVALTFTTGDSIFSEPGEEYTGAFWRLTVAYTPLGGGAPQVRSYASTDGQTWTQKYSFDFGSLSAPSGTTSRYYGHALVKDTGEAIVVAVARGCIDAATTPKQVLTWRYVSIEGGYSVDTSLRVTLTNLFHDDLFMPAKGNGDNDFPGGVTLLAESGRCGYWLSTFNTEAGSGFFWEDVDINLDTVEPTTFRWENVPEWAAPREWEMNGNVRNGNPSLSAVVNFLPYVSVGEGGSLVDLPYGVINSPTGLLIAQAFGTGPFSATDIYGVRAMESCYTVPDTPSNNGWSIYAVVSSPEKGSVIFWKDSNGAIPGVSFTDFDTPADFDRPAQRLGVGGPAFEGDFRYCFGLGFFVCDVFAFTPGNAPSTPTTIYITDLDGRIWAMLPGATAQITLVSDYFVGKTNLRIARAGEAWVASYDGLDNLGDYVNTMVEFSFNLTDWFVGVPLNGSSHPGMVSRAKDILPLGPSGNVERIIPDSELGLESSSIFIDQIP